MKNPFPIRTFLSASLALALLLGSASLAPALEQRGAASPEKRAARQRVLQSVLTKDEQMRLRAAHQKARNDPAVQAARAAGDRRGAHAAMREALLRADPTIGPVADKAHNALRAAHGKRK